MAKELNGKQGKDLDRIGVAVKRATAGAAAVFAGVKFIEKKGLKGKSLSEIVKLIQKG